MPAEAPHRRLLSVHHLRELWLSFSSASGGALLTYDRGSAQASLDDVRGATQGGAGSGGRAGVMRIRRVDLERRVCRAAGLRDDGGAVVVAATGAVSTRLMSDMAEHAGIPQLIPQGDQHGYLPPAASALCGLPLAGLATIPDTVFPCLPPAAVCDGCRRLAARDGLTTSSPGYRCVPGRYRGGRGLRADVLRAVMGLGADIRAALGDRLQALAAHRDTEALQVLGDGVAVGV